MRRRILRLNLLQNRSEIILGIADGDRLKFLVEKLDKEAEAKKRLRKEKKRDDSRIKESVSKA